MKRRTVLGGLASVTGAAAVIPLVKLVAAPAGSPRVRHDATSKEGKAMLKLYAAGVKALKAAKADHPLSWTFQWYIHHVNGNASKKDQELELIFGPNPSKAKDLAKITWSTCQAHNAGMNEFNFLPWHRAYVLYFEKIIRSLTKDEFTLPYWDYTTNAALPEEFLKKDDTIFGSLYDGQRNALAMQGKPIAGKNLINLDPLKQATYLPGPNGLDQGFNENLDRTLHGYVHVYTGNNMNMGSINWAARDPIFWLHHCNIDRLWAAWNANGGTNPTSADWKGQSYTFVNTASQAVLATNVEMTAIAPLGYKYDKLPAKPTLVAARATETQVQMSAAAPPPAQVATLDHAITLGSGPIRVQLAPSRSVAAETLETSGPRRTYLVVSDVHTNIQPGVAYSIYATGTTKTFLGAIQFFDAKPQGTNSDSRFVFDITDKIGTSGSGTPLSYEIVPEGSPDEAAKPLVGSISVVKR